MGEGKISSSILDKKSSVHNRVWKKFITKLLVPILRFQDSNLWRIYYLSLHKFILGEKRQIPNYVGIA